MNSCIISEKLEQKRLSVMSRSDPYWSLNRFCIGSSYNHHSDYSQSPNDRFSSSMNPLEIACNHHQSYYTTVRYLCVSTLKRNPLSFTSFDNALQAHCKKIKSQNPKSQDYDREVNIPKVKCQKCCVGQKRWKSEKEISSSGRRCHTPPQVKHGLKKSTRKIYQINGF